MPIGERIGSVHSGRVDQPSLYTRLRKHAGSIGSVENLSLGDFRCRFLIVDVIWIPLGEQLLILRYRPIWKRTVLQGFGINAPGRGRAQQKRSAWDTVHPGRAYAANLPPNDRTAEEILHALKQDRGQDLIAEDAPE
jgi:hypothetical protein